MKLGIVIPCYNEAQVIDKIVEELKQTLNQLQENGNVSDESFICFVDDGSSDGTWEKICALKARHSFVRGLKLSRNFGQQNALVAGLMRYKDEADALISMDADLQDDVSLIETFVEKYHDGYDVVYGVRESREHDTFWKKIPAKIFYKIQHFMGIETVPDHAHYRMMSRKALHALAKFQEIDIYLRGIIPLVGFKTCRVPYRRQKRFRGESKYTLTELFGLALDGITSFSVAPLRIITLLGFLLLLFSLGMIVWTLIEKIVLHRAVQGWASLMTSIYFIGAIQMMSLGIIGEYIGRIYQQSKNRPRYIVDQEI